MESTGQSYESSLIKLQATGNVNEVSPTGTLC